MGQSKQGARNPVNLIPSTRRPVVLVSGAYRGSTVFHVTRNIIRARRIARTLWNSGIANICPHLNSVYMPEQDERFLHGYLEMVHRVDALVMVPGWEKSEGAMAEYTLADILHKPIFINAIDSCIGWYHDQLVGER